MSATRLIIFCYLVSTDEYFGICGGTGKATFLCPEKKTGLYWTVQGSTTAQMSAKPAIYTTHIWQVGDASAINGQNEFGKVKREYIKKRGATRLEPLDIIPLANKAFPGSFGNKNVQVKQLLTGDGIL